ncbi:hypothetical protein Mp_Vg00020 [Marchantia polymorpha subsp. ruderalis]|nr:hypothetical protein MARPO_YB0049 [Marchantia polymorpha]BBN20442.1 hypothetical protein Mp_Vg00020 [Marchantia polymorpha subsp. ruderalis]|eukprot:PTQ26109.1 hypothetical protein MARPO_YB0049 [Marchantia polymorpha]
MLTELLKKEQAFVWTSKRQAAFENLKKQLVSAPILLPPVWTKEFHMTIDASGWCLGAILWQHDDQQRECPVYNASRQMSSAERNYTTTEREALSVVYSCKKFRHYLLGYKIIFHTDHDSLKYLGNKLDLLGRIARWILLLQEFNYKVVVKPGKTNANADYLSRMRGLAAVADISSQFLDEFPVQRVSIGAGAVRVEPPVPSEYEDIINYLKTRRYLAELSRDKKVANQYKVAPYTLISGVLFCMGSDDKIR